MRTGALALVALLSLGGLASAAPGGAASTARRSRLLGIMSKGSQNASRTTTVGWRTLPPPGGAKTNVAKIAKRNFREAAELVVDHHRSLPLSLATATKLNRLLTRDLVPEAVRGQGDFYGRDPRPFYRWLGSKEARALGKRDPVLLAERIHHEVSGLDAFPDGNGRTARLLADLSLLRAGRAPAYYTSLVDYFQRGAVRAEVSRDKKVLYFREIAERGEKALAGAGPAR